MKFLAFCAFLMSFVMIGGCASTMPQWYAYHSNPPPPASMHLERPTFPVYLDTQFTAEQYTTIGAVLNEWNYALNGTAKFVVMEKQVNHSDTAAVAELSKTFTDTNEGLYIVGANSDDDMFDGQLPEGVLAYCNGLGPREANEIVIVKNRIGFRSLHQIFLHEVAHYAGSSHIDSQGLEWRYYGGNDQTDCIDKKTLANVAKALDLPLENLNWCRIPGFE